MVGIYKITNLNNQKSYIGKSTNIEQRFQTHKNALAERRHQLDFTSDTSWYTEACKESTSINDFQFEVLQECEESELSSLEAYWTKFYNSHIDGYNKRFASEGITLSIDKTIDNFILPENIIGIPLQLFSKINEKIGGKNGNTRMLLLYLISLALQGQTVIPAEATILDVCKFNHARYVEARKALVQLGLIEYTPYTEIKIKLSSLLS